MLATRGILTRLAASLQESRLVVAYRTMGRLVDWSRTVKHICCDAPARRELIVVASLVEKHPTSRTAEHAKSACVFVGCCGQSVIHGRSVCSDFTADRDLAPHREVPPAWLMAYLEEQRTLGLSDIAVEQTSTSTTLEEFCWPEKAVLLLGKVSPSRQLHIERRPRSRATDRCRVRNLHVLPHACCGASRGERGIP